VFVTVAQKSSGVMSSRNEASTTPIRVFEEPREWDASPYDASR
jgi:hypothetical protein